MKTVQEEKNEWSPTSIDTRALAEGMKGLKVKQIGGRNWYPFEQYCLSKGIISVGEGMYSGQLQVVSPFEWGRIIKTHELLKWQNEKDMEKIFQAFPEEKEAYEAKLEVLKNEIREIFTRMKVTN